MLLMEQIKQMNLYLSRLYYKYFQDNDRTKKEEVSKGVKLDKDSYHYLSDEEFTNFLSEMDKLNLLRKEQENRDRK